MLSWRPIVHEAHEYRFALSRRSVNGKVILSASVDWFQCWRDDCYARCSARAHASGGKNAPDGMKTGECKVGAKIHHPCFSGPLLIMGVKKGVFREDAPVVFRFQLTPDGWAMDQLLH